MKKIRCWNILLALCLFILMIQPVTGQPPAPPGGNGWNGNQGPGGMAPVDGGTVLLLLSSAFYGAVRIYRSFIRDKYKPDL